jgi:head-tail adaptor
MMKGLRLRDYHIPIRLDRLRIAELQGMAVTDIQDRVTCWANIRSLNVGINMGLQPSPVPTHEITLRCREKISLTDRITTSSGRRFKIVNLRGPEEGSDLVTLLCEELAP